MMYDLVAVGECLIDFVSKENEDSGSLLYEGNPGGAPANVLAAGAKLGLKTAFIGKVGNDQFGLLLKNTLDTSKIDTSSLVMSGEFPTTLAFVSLDKTGNRSFSFYRRATADVNLTEGEINFELIRRAKIFHFGSVSLTEEPSRGATLAAVRFAMENNITVSYDPNLRERLWKNLDEAKTEILKAMHFADIVKVSDEELRFLTGIDEIEPGMRALYRNFQLSFLAVTMGPKGCCCMCGETVCTSPTFDVKCVDTTGAGDSFWGALLYQVIQSGKPFAEYSEEDLLRFMDFANAAGSLTTTKKGAIPALPTEREITDCIAQVPYLVSQ